MAATEPAVLAILAVVEARLANIKTTNDYWNTVKAITQGRMVPIKDYDLPAANYWHTNVLNSKNAYNSDQREVNLFIEMYSSTRDDTFTVVAERIASDVVTAVNRAVAAPEVGDAPSWDLGGIITDLVFNGYDLLINPGSEPFCGALVKFGVVYTTDPFDMFAYEVD